jgi:hypothetical protein
MVIIFGEQEAGLKPFSMLSASLLSTPAFHPDFSPLVILFPLRSSRNPGQRTLFIE